MLNFEKLKKIASILKPYIGFSKNNLVRTSTIFAIVISNIIEAILLVFINTSMTALFGAIATPGITYTIFFCAILNSLFYISLYAATLVIKYAFCDYLIESLSRIMSKELATKWLNQQSFYGLKFVLTDHQSKKLNIGKILKDDSHEISNSAVSLAESALNSFFYFINGIYHLSIMSSQLTFTALGRNFVIPGYMALGALFYSISYNFLTGNYNQSLKNAKNAKRNQENRVLNLVAHIETNAEAIAFQESNNNEKSNVINNLQKLIDRQRITTMLSSKLNIFESIHSKLSAVFGLLLSIPSVINNTLSSTKIFEVNQYFEDVVKFFTWQQANIADILALEISIDRTNEFKAIMEKWNKTKEECVLKQNYGKNLVLENLYIYTPNGDTLIEDLSIEIPKRKVTLISGRSGAGKSTLLRTLAGLWPFAKGKITYPASSDGLKKQTLFIPQKPCFPFHSTLYEAVIYPEKLEPTVTRINQIKNLMKQLDFSEYFINNLNTQGQWGKILSPGQQQRLAIISAIIHKPKVLFMDEATSALDCLTKQKVECLIKKELSTTTIVYVDHNPNSVTNTKKGSFTPFYDEEVNVYNTKRTSKQPTSLKENSGAKKSFSL